MKRIRMTRKEVEQYLINMRILPFAELQDPCKDLISRQGVKDWFCTNYCSEHNKCEHFEKGDCNAMIELFAIPSVKSKPITIQEKQAESEKYQKAFDDGYENGYLQARSDYEQDPLEVEAEKLQKAYNKGFEAGSTAVKETYFMRVCRKCGLEYCGYSKCPRCGGDQYDLHYIK